MNKSIVFAALMFASLAFPAVAAPIAYLPAPNHQAYIVVTDNVVEACPTGSYLAVITDANLEVSEKAFGCWTMVDDETMAILWTEIATGDTTIIKVAASEFVPFVKPEPFI